MGLIYICSNRNYTNYKVFLFSPLKTKIIIIMINKRRIQPHLRTSIGTGKMMVEFFSHEMELSVWRYLSCMAAWLPAMVSLAAFRATLALFSPSAAITWRELRTGPTGSWAYLGSGFSGGFSLGCHGSLQLDWKSNIFTEQ